METKIWLSIRSWTARLQDISLFLLSWRLNCHFLPEMEALSPSVLLLSSVDSGWISAELLEVGLADEDVEMKIGSETPLSCPSSAVCPPGPVAGCSGNNRSVKHWLCTAEFFSNKPVLISASLSTCSFIWCWIVTVRSAYLHFCPEELCDDPQCWASLESLRSLHCCGSHCSPW